MDVEAVKQLKERCQNLLTALGMDFISTPEEDVCKATMTVDDRDSQSFGFLCGCASLTLAEDLAGLGSLTQCPGKTCVGISVSGNHMRAVAGNDTVIAMAHLISKGYKLHAWDVYITDCLCKLISILHVINYIITPKNQTNE